MLSRTKKGELIVRGWAALKQTDGVIVSVTINSWTVVVQSLHKLCVLHWASSALLWTLWRRWTAKVLSSPICWRMQLSEIPIAVNKFRTRTVAAGELFCVRIHSAKIVVLPVQLFFYRATIEVQL